MDLTAGAVGTVGSLSEAQQEACRYLPQPIAAAWQEVLLARSTAQLEQRLLTMTDVVFRMLGVLAMADYLRGPPVPAVEAYLRDLDDPQPETWLGLLNAAVDAVFRRAEPRPFALELLVWAHGPRGEPAIGQRHLEHVLKLRRTLVTATDTLSIEDGGTPTERLLLATLDLCESLHWLAGYRLLRPSTLTTLRPTGFSGRMQVLAGGAETPATIDAAWTAHLLLDTVYWSNPDASALLDLTPFVRMLPHPRLKRLQCFLFAAAPGLKRLQLRHDASEVTVETSVTGAGGESTLAKWLEERHQHVTWLENRDLSGSLSVQPALMHVPQRQRPPSRPIPDLSANAFQDPAWQGRRPSSALTPAVQRQKQWLLVAQVAILVVIVGVGARMLTGGRVPGRDEGRVVQIDDKGVASVVAKVRGGPAAYPAPPPEDPSTTAARLAERAHEAAIQAARRKFEDGSAQAETQPIYAALKWEVAAMQGDWRGDRELARLLVMEGKSQRQRCQKHVLRALTAMPGDAEMTLIAGRCGVKPGMTMVEDRTRWQESVRGRLVEQADKLVTGKRLHIKQNAELALSLLRDAGELGQGRAWLGAARVAWQGLNDAAGCRDALTHAAAATGLSDTERKEIESLQAQCGR